MPESVLRLAGAWLSLTPPAYGWSAPGAIPPAPPGCHHGAVTTTFSHIGICVRDLGRSLRFYTGALGFEEAEGHDIGDEFAALMELDRVALRSQFVRKGPTAIELLQFAEPAADGDGERRPINRLGLTHLSVRVDDLAAAEAAVVAHGGRVVEATRTEMAFGDATLRFVYCTDPDGVRVELMDLGG